MAKVICDYCGSYIDSTNEKCPNCGAVNSGFQRVANDTPVTIEQLQSWYAAKKLPPENITRFFIGKNVHEARAFGIYQDSEGDFVVYKNKDDGSRAVRYKGKDEAYAVNEIYLKLKAEILQQKERKQSTTPTRSTTTSSRKSGDLTEYIVAVVIEAVITGIASMIFGFRDAASLMLLLSVIWFFRCIKNGGNIIKPILSVVVFVIIVSSMGKVQGTYYQNNDTIYYNVLDDWYYYDNSSNSWYSQDYAPDSYTSYTWDDSNGYQSFKDSDYYDNYDWSSGYEFNSSGSGSDWDWGDDDYDWDWGSDWDSGWDSDWGSDWGSDW